MFGKNISSPVATVTAILPGSDLSVLLLSIVLQDAICSFSGLSRVQRVYFDAIKYHKADVKKSRLE